MIKALMAGLLTCVAAAACFFLPTRTISVGAYPENLFTNDGQWREASKRPHELFHARRTEHGFPLTWLVVDRGIKEPAWYAKRNDGLFVCYIAGSLALGGAVFVMVMRRSRGRRP